MHNLRVRQSTIEGTHSLRKLPVSLRCCWADSDFFVFCSNSFDPPDPDLWRFFAFSGHAKLLSRELPENILGWYPPPHFHSWTSHIYSRGCSRWCQQCHIETDVTFPLHSFLLSFVGRMSRWPDLSLFLKSCWWTSQKCHHNSLFILTIFALDWAVTLLQHCPPQHNSVPCNVITITVLIIPALIFSLYISPAWLVNTISSCHHRCHIH